MDNFEDVRTRKRITEFFTLINNRQADPDDIVNRLLIEYLVRAIDEYDTANKGRTDEFTIRLPINTANITQVYFTSEYQDKNIPAGYHISHPRIPVGNLLIINTGPNSLKFATNRLPDDIDLKSELRDQEFKTIPTGRRNTIFSLFMRAEESVDVQPPNPGYTEIRVEFIY